MKRVRNIRPTGKGQPVKGNRGGCVYTPNNQMAEALTACLKIAREMSQLALHREVHSEVRTALIDMEERMDNRIFALTGVRYYVPPG